MQENRISLEISAADLKTINDSIAALEQVLEKYAISLSADENRLYGKLGNETENFARMIHDDAQQTPSLIPYFVDSTEWKKDVDARGFLLPAVTRIKALHQKMDETNRLLGFDIYQTSLSIYNYNKYQAEQNVPGAKTFYEKWKVQFPQKGRPKKA